MKCMYIWKLGSIHSVYLVNKIEVMDEESGVIEVLCCTIMASASVLFNETQHVGKRKRTCWVKNYFRKRDQYGAYRLTLEELRFQDPYSFRRYLRMDTHVYEVILYPYLIYNLLSVFWSK